MALLGRLKRLEMMCGMDGGIEAELRNMTDEELENRIRELDPGFLEMSAEDQEKAIVALGKDLAARGELP